MFCHSVFSKPSKTDPKKESSENFLFKSICVLLKLREYVGALATIELVESRSKTEDFNVGS